MLLKVYDEQGNEVLAKIVQETCNDVACENEDPHDEQEFSSVQREAIEEIGTYLTVINSIIMYLAEGRLEDARNVVAFHTKNMAKHNQISEELSEDEIREINDLIVARVEQNTKLAIEGLL